MDLTDRLKENRLQKVYDKYKQRVLFTYNL